MSLSEDMRPGSLNDRQVEAVLAASRVLVGVSAESIGEVEDIVTITQLRALVVVASHGSMHVSAMAEAIKVHPSNATRTCDRLVELGLLGRRENPTDRRHMMMDLTDSGREVVHSVMQSRRRAIADILFRMKASDREDLARVLTGFASAGGEPTDHQLWSIGWTTDSPSMPVDAE